MEELHNLTSSQLLDLLAEQTAVVTKLITEKNFDDAYEKEKLYLKAIQTEVDLRKDTDSTSITTPPDFTT